MELKEGWFIAVKTLISYELGLIELSEDELKAVVKEVLNKRAKGAAITYLGRKYRHGIL